MYRHERLERRGKLWVQKKGIHTYYDKSQVMVQMVSSRLIYGGIGEMITEDISQNGMMRYLIEQYTIGPLKFLK